ncbi:MAG TPA: aldose epimerase family protein [Humibacillus xanthopallidus]|nr:aldose epimerase family protein [Humibacillus xanthopallidus]
MSADAAPPTSVLLRADGILLEVLTAGAAVRRLEVPAPDGRTVGIVLGHANTRTYVTAGGYLGATIGRFGNRIAGACFELGGQTHRLSANEGTTTLHGGLDGFDHRPWTIVDQDAGSVRFGLHSPDGDQGFPGALDVAVTYAVGRGLVRIDYEATTDGDTLVNLTNHSYFNLDGESTGPVDDHELMLSASRFTPTDALLIPTGEVRRVDGTPFDFRAPRRVGEALAHRDEQLEHGQGLDHNFVVDGEGLRHVATLRGRSGLTLDVDSDQPGVQVYTGAHFDGTVTGTSGTAYGPRSGIALETQGFPDAPHHPGFPSTVLRAGETLRSTTVWRLR